MTKDGRDRFHSQESDIVLYSGRLIAEIIFLCTFLFLLSFPPGEPVSAAQTLTPDDIIKLKEAGVSDEVILEMIKKGKAIEKSEKKKAPVDQLLDLLNSDINFISSDFDNAIQLAFTGAEKPPGKLAEIIKDIKELFKEARHYSIAVVNKRIGLSILVRKNNNYVRFEAGEEKSIARSDLLNFLVTEDGSLGHITWVPSR